MLAEAKGLGDHGGRAIRRSRTDTRPA